MTIKNEKIIVALDLADIESANSLVEKLGNLVSFYKIGLSLTPIGGFDFAKSLKARGKKVFLDLKLFDIGQTIKNSVKNIEQTSADFLTVHGDPQVVRAAVSARNSKNMKILAVTFLTSLDRTDLTESLIQDGDITTLTIERARRAFLAGADGIIASPLEVSEIRSIPEAVGKLIVTPGVRLTSHKVNDQKRVLTPRRAILAGSDYVVIGRPIYQSDHPVFALEKILADST